MNSQLTFIVFDNRELLIPEDALKDQIFVFTLAQDIYEPVGEDQEMTLVRRLDEVRKDLLEQAGCKRAFNYKANEYVPGYHGFQNEFGRVYTTAEHGFLSIKEAIDSFPGAKCIIAKTPGELTRFYSAIILQRKYGDIQPFVTNQPSVA